MQQKKSVRAGKLAIVCGVVLVWALLIGGFTGTSAADHTQGKKLSLTVATGVVMNNPIQLAVSEMCRRIQEATGGRITFSEHHNSALGSERELLEQESTGMVDIVAGGSQTAYN
ncbi:hypothetical protein AGMMS50276_27980 [Synergistales bacterium]|nr:hypothetical protein AGMMS50276_27980 [Synergistales bacterium]